MKSFLVLLIPVSLFLFSPAALASGNYVLNGATLSYTGANQLRVGAGTVSQTSDFSAQTVPATTFSTVSSLGGAAFWAGGVCPTNYNSNLQAANTAYYVYFWPLHGIFMLSSEPPSEDGYDSPVIIGYRTSSGGCNYDTTGEAVFVGSFMTDTAGNIIPFERVGEQVLLLQNTTNNPFGHVYNYFTSNRINTVTYNAFPVTASALIVDVDVYGTNTVVHNVSTVDPNFNGSTTTCPTDGGFPIAVDIITSAPGTSNGHRVIVPTAFSSTATTVSLGVCDTSSWTGGSVGVWETVAGYVEPVHHLNEIR